LIDHFNFENRKVIYSMPTIYAIAWHRTQIQIASYLFFFLKFSLQCMGPDTRRDE
jgi:hypothetical protein